MREPKSSIPSGTEQLVGSWNHRCVNPHRGARRHGGASEGQALKCKEEWDQKDGRAVLTDNSVDVGSGMLLYNLPEEKETTCLRLQASRRVTTAGRTERTRRLAASKIKIKSGKSLGGDGDLDDAGIGHAMFGF